MLSTPLSKLETYKSDWADVLKDLFFTDYVEQLNEFLTDEAMTNRTILPAAWNMFDGFLACPFKETKVVVVGQDPYPSADYATGLAFSNPFWIDKPARSLRNILKEMYRDLGWSRNIRVSPDLTPLAEEGILWMNRVLSVREGKAGSHKHQGWEKFTADVIRKLNKKQNAIVFVLWGQDAQEVKHLIDETKHFVIESAHPSPLSAYRGFFFSKPFSKINECLALSGQSPIIWSTLQKQSTGGAYGGFNPFEGEKK